MSTDNENIWEFQAKLSGRLFMINILNMSLGERLIRRKGFWRAFGIQALVWGIINIGIAIFGRITSNNRMDKLENPLDDAVMKKETRNLRLLLWLNTGLDVLYMLVGLRFVRKSNGNSRKRGTGAGIILQGLLLFVFDLVHAQELSSEEQQHKI